MNIFSPTMQFSLNSRLLLEQKHKRQFFSFAMRLFLLRGNVRLFYSSFTYAKQSPFDFSIVVVLLRVVFSIRETKSAVDRKQEKEKKQLAAFVI